MLTISAMINEFKAYHGALPDWNSADRITLTPCTHLQLLEILVRKDIGRHLGVLRVCDGRGRTIVLCPGSV